MSEAVEQLVSWWKEAKHTVFFGGAGVSTESGVPDFRSSGGIYAHKPNAEFILTPGYMNSHPTEFYEFYRKYLIVENVKPNAAHLGLARLEKAGKLDLIVTQNIDGLHQAAGSQNVIELHGNAGSFTCTRCGAHYDTEYVLHQKGVPRCRRDDRYSSGQCNGMIRPDIVLYEETLNFKNLNRAGAVIARSDLLVVGGSSLQVYPAAGLVEYQEGGKVVVINLEPTHRDKRADLVIREPLGKVFAEITSRILDEDLKATGSL